MLSSIPAIARGGQNPGKSKRLLAHSRLDLSYTHQLFSSCSEMLGFCWHHEKTGDELRWFSLPFSSIHTSASVS